MSKDRKDYEDWVDKIENTFIPKTKSALTQIKPNYTAEDLRNLGYKISVNLIQHIVGDLISFDSAIFNHKEFQPNTILQAYLREIDKLSVLGFEKKQTKFTQLTSTLTIVELFEPELKFKLLD